MPVLVNLFKSFTSGWWLAVSPPADEEDRDGVGARLAMFRTSPPHGRKHCSQAAARSVQESHNICSHWFLKSGHTRLKEMQFHET